jgi:hypothetical protein
VHLVLIEAEVTRENLWILRVYRISGLMHSLKASWKPIAAADEFA